MIAIELPAALGSIGSTSFALLAWGAIFLVLVAFAYVLWARISGIQIR